ncbi:MAG: hypothetical protein GEU92_11045 [Alphaproteobacteria bacterium]|nr:hypothetical protein [Alphaproteobacteria bacterium]
MPDAAPQTFDEVFNIVKSEAVVAFTDLRQGVMETARIVIVHQMRQIATAVWDVMEGLAAGDYTPEGAAELLDMARRAAATAISGATELLYSEVQAAVTRIYNALMNAVAGTVKTALGAVL